jgi:glucose-1-phosphate cytidylyltransferase
MVEVGGKPVLWHIMKHYAHYGFNDFVICAGYRGTMIKEYFLNYEALTNDFTIHLGSQNATIFHDAHQESDWCVTVVDTGMHTPTGGRVKRIERFADASTFMVTYGDGLADVDLHSLLAFHRGHGRLATLTAVQPMSRFGILELNDEGSVTAFREKPRSEDWVNGGFFVFEPEVFEYLGSDHVLEQHTLEAMAADKQLMAYRHRGFWQPVDTYRELTLLNELWDQGAPWRCWQE